ncbi:MAG: TIGR01777 family oxidoreductase [Terrimicrobiaceae bacterium]|nr:TIGR01777 family oxidoreductase [Terrimicrobiaceae bacterium]
MRILIAGGTGQVGQILRRHFAGHEMVTLTRHPERIPGGVLWDGRTLGPWTRHLEGADVLINLAGRSVNCRYHSRNRREILESRVASTKVLADAVAGLGRPPTVWLQASTATIYRHTFGSPHGENGEFGGDEPGAPAPWNFSIEVAKAWEAETMRIRPEVRVVLMRSAMIMSPDPGGVFDTLLALVRVGLGGPLGGGRQFVSWIHEHDFCAAVDRLIRDQAMSGPVNLASPRPLANRDFLLELRRAAHVPFGLPATRWMLELGAWAMRTETELVLKSRRVIPARLLANGFVFRFPEWAAAAEDLCRRSSRS